MKKIWDSKIENNDDLIEVLREGLAIIRFWNTMLPQSKLIKPRWFRYALVFPLQMKRLNDKYDTLVMKDICMEGLEHFHKLIKE